MGEEGTGMLMVDDVDMYLPFLHPLVVDSFDKVLSDRLQEAMLVLYRSVLSMTAVRCPGAAPQF